MSNDACQPPKKIDQLLILRLIVGYLGQAKQAGWWDCNFLDSTGIRFLETTFPRTAKSAALRSTSDAACIVHDKALGRIGSYHLFRLPPALEDWIEHAYEKINWDETFMEIQSNETALASLQQIADALITASEGPVQVGVEKKILTSTSIQELAAHYHSAFKNQIKCYPYFAPEEHAK
jgi:hypothetical protein